jgi:hypothetical protein
LWVWHRADGFVYLRQPAVTQDLSAPTTANHEGPPTNFSELAPDRLRALLQMEEKSSKAQLLPSVSSVSSQSSSTQVISHSFQRYNDQEHRHELIATRLWGWGSPTNAQVSLDRHATAEPLVSPGPAEGEHTRPPAGSLPDGQDACDTSSIALTPPQCSAHNDSNDRKRTIAVYQEDRDLEPDLGSLLGRGSAAFLERAKRESPHVSVAPVLFSFPTKRTEMKITLAFRVRRLRD